MKRKQQNCRVKRIRDLVLAHDEETNTAAQSEDRFVRAQVLGELVRDGGHYGLNGGKLE